MKLIFGGAYQGKLEYALSLIESDSEKETKVNKDNVKLKQSAKNNSAGANTLVYTCPDIRTCASPEECLAALDPAKAISAMKPAPVIIDHLERMVYALIDAGRDPVEYVKKNINLLFRLTPRNALGARQTAELWRYSQKRQPS